MPCLIGCFAIVSPRLALFFVWIFSDMLGDAYDSWLVPILGFFLLPWTTLAYAVMWDSGAHGVNGLEWFLVVLAFLVDLSSWFGGKRAADERFST